jgi:hypothetical protein
MTGRFADEVAANLERAQHSINAARQLEAGLYYDFAAGRAYYAAFYAATALLLHDGVEMSRHSGVIAASISGTSRPGSWIELRASPSTGSSSYAVLPIMGG